MGYTTDFEGSLSFNRPMTEKERDYINLLCRTRRMKRNANKLMELYKGKHGNPFAKNNTVEEVYGFEGEFFAMDDGNSGQGQQCPSIIDYNVAPGQVRFLNDNKNGQPGLWCQWEISEDSTELRWDGGEKFYNYIPWLLYLINKFFISWGIVANGSINWFGEDRDDMGQINVKDNVVKVMGASYGSQLP